MHRDDPVAQGLELAHKPAAVDQCGADPLREDRGRLRVLHEVVMKSHDPMRPGELPGSRGKPPRLLGRNQAAWLPRQKSRRFLP
jgi:hypothetical protein